MAGTNILNGLNVTSQTPLDTKTTVNILTDITNFGNGNEKVYTYYKSMRVRVIATDKEYVWKPINASETAVSPTFTYPQGHIVNGVDYSNTSYAFYEDTSGNAPIGNDYKYKAMMTTEPYTREQGENTGSLDSSWSFTGPDENNDYVSNIGIRPIASRTLQVFNPPNNIGWGGSANTAIPLRIELYPVDSVVVSPDGADGTQFESIEGVQQAVGRGEIAPPREIILIPPRNGADHIRDFAPISFPSTVVLAPGVTFNPDNALFTGTPNVRQGVRVESGAVLNLTNSPIVDAGVSTILNVEGTGRISNMSGGPMIGSAITGIAGRSASPSTGNGITIQDVALDITSGSIAEVGADTTLRINNSAITSTVNGVPLITTDSANLELSNLSLDLNNMSGGSFIEVSGASDVKVEGLTASGSLSNLIKVGSEEDGTSTVNVKNSDLSKMVIQNIVNSAKGLDQTDLTKYKITSVDFSVIGVADKTFEHVQTFSTSTTDKEIPKRLPQYPDRDSAEKDLPLYSLFINTNDDNVDTATYFIDVVI